MGSSNEIRWAFDINRPTGNFMRELASLIHNDIWISEQSNDFATWFMFSSSHLNDLTDHGLIYDRAMKFKMLVDGYSFLIHEDKNAYSPIVLGKLYNEQNEVVHFEMKMKNRLFDFSYLTDAEGDSFKINAVSHLMALAASQAYVRNILLICSSGMDFTSLYKALDETKTYLKGKAGLETMGINTAALKRFTHTVNNFESIGVDARHGNLGHDAPATPMTLPEAQVLITEIISVVLKQHYDIHLPTVPDIRITADDLF